MRTRNDSHAVLMMVAFMVVAVSILAFPLMSEDVVSGADGNSNGDGSSSGSSTSSWKDANSITAHGTCGSITWTYNYSGSGASLSLRGSGKIPMASNSSWTVNSLTADGETVQGQSFNTIIRVTRGVSLTLSTGITGESRAMASLNPTSVRFDGDSGTIGEQVFLECKTLNTVYLDNISSVGARAFKGCTISTVYVSNADLDPTCFEDCNLLNTFVANGSTKYSVEGSGHYLLTKDRKTLVMCANGYKGENGVADDIPNSVTTVNLGYANVILAIDLKDRYATNNPDPKVTFVNAIDNPVTLGLAYSTLGFSTTPTLTKVDGGLKMSYRTYKGWAVDETSATLVGNNASANYGNGEVTVHFKGGCEYLPMGVVNLTYAQLSEMKYAGGWIVDASNLPDRKDESTVTSIDGPIPVIIRGYNGSGSATLAETIYFHGIICHVDKVEAKGGQMSDLKELVIGPGVDVGSEAFSNCPNLVSVTGENVESVGDMAFQYCVKLESVEFPNCTYFGKFAFGFCVKLNEITLGAKEVEFDPTATEGCMDLKMIKVDMDMTVTGIQNVTILHYQEPPQNTYYDFQIFGDFLYIEWYFASNVKYYHTVDASDVQTVEFYYGPSEIYVTLIPMSVGDLYIEVTSGPQSSGKYLVIFNPGLGMDPHNELVSIDNKTKLTKVWEPSAWGYDFKGWEYNGVLFDFNQPITSSMVLTAVWGKANTLDFTPFYLLVIFLVSIIATFVLIGVTRKIS